MARRSATECAAIEHACRRLGLVSEEATDAARSLLDRVVAMLTTMTLRLKKPGAEAGEEAGEGPDKI